MGFASWLADCASVRPLGFVGGLCALWCSSVGQWLDTSAHCPAEGAGASHISRSGAAASTHSPAGGEKGCVPRGPSTAASCTARSTWYCVPLLEPSSITGGAAKKSATKQRLGNTAKGSSTFSPQLGVPVLPSPQAPAALQSPTLWPQRCRPTCLHSPPLWPAPRFLGYVRGLLLCCPRPRPGTPAQFSYHTTTLICVSDRFKFVSVCNLLALVRPS